MAYTHLEPIDPRDAFTVLVRPRSKKRKRKSETAVITHGTFAADSDWYQPGGDFFGHSHGATVAHLATKRGG